jgi:hypothetical protein
MKKTITILISFLFAAQAIFGQEATVSEPQFLFSRDNGIRVSGFGAPIVEFSSVDGEFAVCSGGGGAVLINQQFFFGAYGMGLATDQPRYSLTVINAEGKPVSYKNYRPMIGHGGFWLGYIHDYKNLLHWGISTKIGWGAVSLVDPKYKNDWNELGWDAVFVFSPQAEMEINLFTWFKFNVGLGYRMVSGVNDTYVNQDHQEMRFFKSDAFSSPTATVSLLFGNFTK